jgi:hypothetical protein
MRDKLDYIKLKGRENNQQTEETTMELEKIFVNHTFDKRLGA